jgi:hypothetical protein
MAIYDYGPGRTYGTPQAAFNACQAANEVDGVPQNFHETNYIRGYGGAAYPGFASGEPVLRLVHSGTGRGVKPTQGSRLVIDRNGADSIEFADDQDAGCIVGGASDGTRLASHVTVDGINLHSSATATGRGLVVCPDRTGGEFARDWVIRNLAIYASWHGIVLGNLRSALLSAVRFLGFAGGAGVYADGSGGTYGAAAGGMVMLNCAARAEGPVVKLKGHSLAAAIVHGSFYSAGNVIQLDHDNGSDSLDLILLDSILETRGESAACLATDFPELRLLYANANCYHFPGASARLLDLNGAGKNFNEFKSCYGQDANSLNQDPRYADPAAGDLSLRPDSPCLMFGRAATPAGLEGNERAISIDPGAYQQSLPANWSLNLQNGQAAARIEGRISVGGLGG